MGKVLTYFDYGEDYELRERQVPRVCAFRPWPGYAVSDVVEHYVRSFPYSVCEATKSHLPFVGLPTTTASSMPRGLVKQAQVD